ncbi:hypothetical protein IQ07DRAFT_589650 [Pyrenochaeta sp. DS3sAY3a]|nr:hypothetical protein IQ07DRAFT_589650 [Pyrenochaeta sp. DS3sAY3a]
MAQLGVNSPKSALHKSITNFDPLQTGPKQCNNTISLFSLPYDIRELIFRFYLEDYTPWGVHYMRVQSAHYHYYHQRIKFERRLSSLYLVSKQVYDEAHAAFCRYTRVTFGPYGREKYLQGTLRLFPYQTAQMLQRVYMSYSWRTPDFRKRAHFRDPSMPKVWRQMLEDAYTLERFLPQLREFTAHWRESLHWFRAHGLELQDSGMCYLLMTEEETIQVWLKWMREMLGTVCFAPPRWLVLEGDKSAAKMAMGKAYQRLVEGHTTVQCSEVELEDSGRKWLEEMSSRERRVKSRKSGKRQ